LKRKKESRQINFETKKGKKEDIKFLLGLGYNKNFFLVKYNGQSTKIQYNMHYVKQK